MEIEKIHLRNAVRLNTRLFYLPNVRQNCKIFNDACVFMNCIKRKRTDGVFMICGIVDRRACEKKTG